MAQKSYTDLVAWQRAMEFVVAVYRATACFPREEIYGLTAQLRRAAVSIPSNIAEGQGRFTSREFRRFLSIAHGSLRECETQIRIAEQLQYLNVDEQDNLLQQSSEIGRLINGLSTFLRRRQEPDGF